ncbi:MAG: hypothetical protein V3U71_02335 [Cocleimonas sp.]
MNKISLKMSVTLAISAISTPALADVTLYDDTETNSSYEDAYFSGSANISKSRNDKQTAYNLQLETDMRK